MSAEDYTGWFNEVDVDGSGALAFSELATALKAKGYPKAETEKFFNRADSSGDDKITLEEFLECMGVADPKTHANACMRSVCLSFDQNNDGTIDKEELKNAINELRGNDRRMTDEEADRLIQMCDENDSGTIDYKELLKHCFGIDWEED